MAAGPEVRIAIVGYGGVAKAHAYAVRVAPILRALPCSPTVQVITGRDAEAVERAAGAYGITEWSTDWLATVRRDDIQLVAVCNPPGAHVEVVEAAAQAGKAVLCEKPLGLGYADARRAAEAVRLAGVPNAISFNYRRLPAVSLMRQMIAAGEIGEVRLWRARWLTDEFADAGIPYDWRFDRRMGGTTIADLGAHLFDLARWMVGEVREVSAQTETFVRERSGPAGPIPVTVDDFAAALLRFENGARGTFEVARSCIRRPCDMVVEVNGSTGTLVFDYARLNELWYGAAGDDPRLYGLRRIRAEHPTHPYAPQWWPLGQGVGWGSSFPNQLADLLGTWPTGPWEPNLADGLRVQAICDAVERSAAERRWVSIAEIESA